MNGTKTNLILLLLSIVIWIVVLVHDIKENYSTLFIIGDIFVIMFIAVLCFSSPYFPSKVKTVQEVENEIIEIENKEK